MLYAFEILEFCTNEILHGDSYSNPAIFSALPAKDESIEIKDKKYYVFRVESHLTAERWDKLVYVLEAHPT